MTSQSFSPPESVRAAARRGLELRKKYGKGGLSTQEAGRQGIGSGVARASNLSSGKAIPLDTIKRMHSFFSRHEKDKAGGPDDAGYISWMLWGGDPGRAWADGIVRRANAAEENSKTASKESDSKKRAQRTILSMLLGGGAGYLLGKKFMPSSPFTAPLTGLAAGLLYDQNPEF